MITYLEWLGLSALTAGLFVIFAIAVYAFGMAMRNNKQYNPFVCPQCGETAINIEFTLGYPTKYEHSNGTIHWDKTVELEEQ